MTIQWQLFLILVMAAPIAMAAEDDHRHDHEERVNQLSGKADELGHDDHGDEHGANEAEAGHEEEGVIHLDGEQLFTAGIVVEPIESRSLRERVRAPGEIRLNSYASSRITPRITAQVVERHALLGDRVERGQPLVTLSSVEMAEAQGALLVAAKEWQRVGKLGRQVVSERRHLEAEVAYQQGRARLIAYGLTRVQVDSLVEEGRIAAADGRFALLSPQQGTVIRDDFIVGQMVEPGALLFDLTDESTLWIEARVSPDAAARLKVGAAAVVETAAGVVAGRVVQLSHAIDETTRTLAVRLEVANPDDTLHTGQFVSVNIETGGEGAAALVVPVEAVVRSRDGDWQLFIEERQGEYRAREVEVVRQLPKALVIRGIEPGSRVVTRGAFFLQSELAKSGFDVHNH